MSKLIAASEKLTLARMIADKVKELRSARLSRNKNVLRGQDSYYWSGEVIRLELELALLRKFRK